jgi:hypothetical protein
MDTFLNVRCPDLQPTRKGRVKKNPIRALRAIHGSAADGHIYTILCAKFGEATMKPEDRSKV